MKKCITFLFSMIAIATYCQNKISGTVLDQENNPLPGVNITLKGKSVGSVTDANGKFVVDAKLGDVLVLAFIGYSNKQATIKKDEDTYVLDSDVAQVSEVVVTASENFEGTVEQFAKIIPDKWDDSSYKDEIDFEKVKTAIIKEYENLSGRVIKISGKREGELYYGSKLRKQNELRNFAITQLEQKYQDQIIAVPSKYPKTEDQNKAQNKLTTALSLGTDSIDVQTNNRIRYIFFAYKIKKWRLLPAKTDIFAKLHYGELTQSGLSFLNNSSLVFGTDLTAFTSNIVSGYPLGSPIRFSLSTVIAKGRSKAVVNDSLAGKNPAQIQSVINDNAKENLKNNTLANVLNGGGFLALKAEYPILSYSHLNLKGKARLEVSVNCAISGEFADGGGSLPATQANFFHYGGIDIKTIVPFTDVNENNQRIETFAFYFSVSERVVNGTDSFFRNLNSINNQPFSQSEVSTGFLFNGVKIYYTYLYFTKPGLNDVYPSRFGITYVPSFF